MVGRGAARLVSDQVRILDSCRCSSCANAASKNFAWRCQDGSLVSGISGDSADGIIPARSFAVSSTVAASAAWPGDRAANRNAAAIKVATLTDCIMLIRDPEMRPPGVAP